MNQSEIILREENQNLREKVDEFEKKLREKVDEFEKKLKEKDVEIKKLQSQGMLRVFK